MKKSLLSLAFALAASALAASAVTSAVTAFVGTATRIKHAVLAVYVTIRDFVVHAAVDLSRHLMRNLPGPRVAILRARQFYLRQVKRERPITSPAWRLAPST